MPSAPLATIAVRVDASLPERLDRVAEELSRRASGANVKRADAHRIALERGLANLERELGLGPMPEAAPPPVKRSGGPGAAPGVQRGGPGARLTQPGRAPGAGLPQQHGGPAAAPRKEQKSRARKPAKKK